MPKFNMTRALAAGGRKLQGQVLYRRMEKTVTVQVQRLVKHDKYKKYVVRSRKYQVHDPAGTAQVGDLVTIKETRPISKTKSWVLKSVDQRAQQSTPPGESS